jgi:5-methylcytosine-specific restriction endonuclease McrA
MTDERTYYKIPRADLVAALKRRDGSKCQYEGCKKPRIDFSITEGPLEPTLDHWMPQWWGKENGWTRDAIWDVSNLKLMHKRCNAAKGDRVPNADGTLPPKVERTWKNRRAKRLQRPEICTECNAGRNLGQGEFCRACQSGPQPARAPKWAQVSSLECDHEEFFCPNCFLNPDLRVRAIETITEGGPAANPVEA